MGNPRRVRAAGIKPAVCKGSGLTLAPHLCIDDTRQRRGLQSNLGALICNWFPDALRLLEEGPGQLGGGTARAAYPDGSRSQGSKEGSNARRGITGPPTILM
eukprot:6778172-Pyramimonas_sp.AAC.1